MTRLRDLDAEFIQHVGGGSFNVDVARDAADGVMFLCPKCYATNNGHVGTHSVICWFVGRVPDEIDPKPGRWHPSGDSIDTLTFTGPGAASVLLTSGCGWHGFVKDGDAT